MTKFQIILTAVFGFFIVLAVMVFALYKGGSSNQNATITIWGDISSGEVFRIFNDTASGIDKTLTLRYVEKSADTLDNEFTEALATGTGPDLLIITQDKFWKNRTKLLAIPYESISERDFKEAFIEESELFLRPDGIYGLPLSVDPLVLYYNRDLLSSEGEAKPITYWDEIYSQTQKFTKRDGAGNLIQSTIALGETRNIPNYKEILSLLMLQAGTPITGYAGENLRSALSSSYDLPIAPAESALDFYSQFSNPAKPYYSWNRSLSDSQTHFASGDSAYYIGFASELRALRNKNPNLNFGVAPVPQSRVSGKTYTYGELRSVVISRGTKNMAASMRAALLLVSKDVSEAFADKLLLPPARRDLLSEKQGDDVLPVFYSAALQSRGWLDPDMAATSNIFKDMIETVSSGRARTTEAISTGSRALDSLIK